MYLHALPEEENTTTGKIRYRNGTKMLLCSTNYYSQFRMLLFHYEYEFSEHIYLRATPYTVRHCRNVHVMMDVFFCRTKTENVEITTALLIHSTIILKFKHYLSSKYYSALTKSINYCSWNQPKYKLILSFVTKIVV